MNNKKSIDIKEARSIINAHYYSKLVKTPELRANYNQKKLLAYRRRRLAQGYKVKGKLIKI